MTAQHSVAAPDPAGPCPHCDEPVSVNDLTTIT
jgi:hypothetical protein